MITKEQQLGTGLVLIAGLAWVGYPMPEHWGESPPVTKVDAATGMMLLILAASLRISLPIVGKSPDMQP